MKFFEMLGFKSKEQLAQEAKESEARAKQAKIAELNRQIVMFQGRVKEVQDNMAAFGWAPGDGPLISDLEGRVTNLKKELSELEGTQTQEQPKTVPVPQEKVLNDEEEAKGEEQPA
jgi:hypothetical protein